MTWTLTTTMWVNLPQLSLGMTLASADTLTAASWKTLSQNLYLYIHLFIRLSSDGYEGWRVSRSAFSKLENQESRCHHSVQVWRLENHEGCWHLVSSESKSTRPRSINVQGQEDIDVSTQAKRANLPVLCSFVLLGSLRDVIMPTRWRGPHLYSVH